MKAENGTFDQWREDARFLCDQYSHAINRVDFYTKFIYQVSQSQQSQDQQQPQLERWQGLAASCQKSLDEHYKRGLRWQIGEDAMQLLLCDYLTAPLFFQFLALAKVSESPELG